MNKDNALEIFEKAPVGRAVLKNAFPAMAAMLMVLVYNLADTLFIGQTRDVMQIAAVSLATPVFLIFMSVGTIFGIGGTSVISRAMGEGRMAYAKKVCSFCMWSCVIVGIMLAACILIFMEQILALVGASPDTWGYAKTYLTVVSFCGPFALIANCFNNVIRAEGQSTKAMMGQLIGNLLNVVLDPVLISGFGLGILGAAIATVIGNVIGAGYYIAYFLRGKSVLGVHPKDFALKEGVCANVLKIGVPASLGTLLMSVAQIIVNSQISTYGDKAVAGVGVAMKVTMITGMVGMGFGQGIQPLLGYCVGAKLWERFQKVMRFSLLFSFCLSTVLTILCYLFAPQLVSVFLTDAETSEYAVSFVYILLSTSCIFGVFYAFTNALQAMGAATESLIINLSRQGIIYIPAIFILNALLGVTGPVWAQPAADALSIILVVPLYKRTLTRMMGRVKLSGKSCADVL